ncbi:MULTISPECIES: GNAT family N-acetyltransferase [Streptomyces]|uniref:GNAT family N-acetyltransferase n=1 Tax=Streptomyces TaxID=1883 RepID=UPI00331C6871
MPHFLETDRLALRAFTPADIDHLFALDNNPEVMRFLNGGRPRSRETVESSLSRLRHDYPCWKTRGYWAAQEKRRGTFLGWFEFRPGGRAGHRAHHGRQRTLPPRHGEVGPVLRPELHRGLAGADRGLRAR